MSKAAQQEPAATEAVAPPAKQSLNEFCSRLSVTVKRPELIGAFAHIERINGRLEDTEAEFQSRFSSFCNKPV
jgi:hypothetical protein